MIESKLSRTKYLFKFIMVLYNNCIYNITKNNYQMQMNNIHIDTFNNTIYKVITTISCD